MKSIFTLGFCMFVFSFCNIADRFTGKIGTEPAKSNSNTNSISTVPADKPNAIAGDENTVTPTPNAAQLAILEGGETIDWEQQSIIWTLPKGWKKISVGKEMLNYSSPDNAFLIASISMMNDTFPVDASIKAYYDSAIQSVKSGKYESVRYSIIDGLKGVEFIETMPEDKSGPRRHQWISYRTYKGQIQMLNIMLSTKGNNFDKHRDTFPAVIYSMKIAK